MEIKVHWADIHATVCWMFILSCMLLHPLPCPSFTPCSQAVLSWTMQIMQLMELHQHKTKLKTSTKTDVFWIPDNVLPSLLYKAPHASLTNEKIWRKKQVAGEILSYYWRKCSPKTISLSPGDSELRKRKPKGRGADRKEPKTNMNI